MKNGLRLFLIIVLITVVGCSKNDDTEPMAECSSNIPFLQEGKYFTYDVVQFGSASGTLKMAIGGCNGSGFLVTRETRDMSGNIVSSSSGTDLWKQDGEFLLADSNNNGDYFSKLYKKNTVLGDTWQITRPTDGAVIKHEVIDIDSLITVPAGSFHCKVFKYTNSATINDSHIFWNDQVGQIKEDAGFFTISLKATN
jgi:hypothetical protein